MRNLCFIFVVIISLYSLQTKAEVFVSADMTTDPVSQYTIVNAGSYQVIPLPSTTNFNDYYKITINTHNAVYRDLTAFIIDEENLTSFKEGYRYKGIGYSKAQTPFILQGSINSPSQKYLLIDNTYAGLINKKVSCTLEAKFEASAEQRENTKKLFSKMYTSLKKDLIFPDFNIYIEPCDNANALSETKTGNIHFCSEMFDLLVKNNNEKAFLGVFLHEVGHSLLGLWGIPGNNNEDIADEFATYILLSGGPNGYAYLDATLQFWQNRNSAAEALNIMQNGDRHSLSIQRMRNIKENMLTGEAFIKKWNRLIYDHHTDVALNDVIKEPTRGADVELATKVLAQRRLYEK